MKLLLDTCVISELIKTKGSQKVKDFITNSIDINLFLSVVTIGELNKGIYLLDNSERKQQLFSWLYNVHKQYADRILPISIEAAEIWGKLTALDQKIGRSLGTADGLIAATAIEHGLTLVTRNTKDFESLGVMLINPWVD